MEDCCLERYSPARIPFRPPFKVPGRLGFEEGIPEIGGVAVVEVGIGRQAEAAARAGAKSHSLAEKEGSGNRWSKFGPPSAEEFLAHAHGQKEALEALEIQVQISRFPVPRVMAQVVAVNLVPVGVQTVGEGEISPMVGASDRGLPALADVVVFIDRGIVTEQDKFIGVAPVAKSQARIFMDGLRK